MYKIKIKRNYKSLILSISFLILSILYLFGVNTNGDRIYRMKSRRCTR